MLVLSLNSTILLRSFNTILLMYDVFRSIKLKDKKLGTIIRSNELRSDVVMSVNELNKIFDMTRNF